MYSRYNPHFMHVAFFTVRMRKGFGVDLCVDKWARGLLDTNINTDSPDANAQKKAFADKITVFCFDYDGETYKNAPYEIVPLHLSRDRLNKLLPLLEADTLNTLRKLKKESTGSDAIDLILCASFPFYGAKKIFDVPVVHLHFGNPPTAGLKSLARVNRTYLDYSDLVHMRRNDRIISISSFLAKNLPASVRAKTDIVFPGADHLPEVDDELLNEMNERIRSAGGYDDNEMLVLSVSRLDYETHPYKGVKETVETINRIRCRGIKVRLVLAGVGSDETCRELERDGAIVFRAPSFAELSALYRLCDVFVSLSKWEGFGLPVAEAALAGLPTVAFNSTAHAENAVSCPVETADQAESTIAMLATDETVMKNKGLEAREKAIAFNWKDSSLGLLKIVKMLAE